MTLKVPTPEEAENFKAMVRDLANLFPGAKVGNYAAGYLNVTLGKFNTLVAVHYTHDQVIDCLKTLNETYTADAKSNAQSYLSRLITVVLDDGMLTEGQVRHITGMDRVDIRTARDAGMASIARRPITGSWGGKLTERLLDG